MSRITWHARACGLLLIGAAATIAARAQTFTSLHSFDGTDGDFTYTALTQATNGNLYGTAYGGGANGQGTVFKMTPAGTLTTLYNFCSQNACADGAEPHVAPVLAANGNLYGTTAQYGANGTGGTVYKITPSGTLTTLHSFCAQSGCADGAIPFAGLVLATNGDFYGTTNGGGTFSYGTIFRITANSTLATLHSFDGADGTYPQGAGLIQATDGNFYGTTQSGGTNGDGTVFKITPSGTLTTLYSFCSQADCADGEDPEAGLVQATDGNFYGTTQSGGTTQGSGGTIFRITPSGTLTTLYRFCSQGGCTDGESPESALIQATDGNFYGTTYNGGANFEGTIFKISLSGALTTLYSFCSQAGCTDGQNPNAPLVQDTNGKFYGTTYQGGANGVGTVFSLSVGLHAFVETVPVGGRVGQSVLILGTNLTGATSVTFSGVAATFKVSSPTLITATVPTGATTGTVKVTTPSGTLSSNTPFRVLP